ncbi:DUF3108 domain-containing protein [bacterium]|nr:DUF3108 domain-containing protein [bacterium]
MPLRSPRCRVSGRRLAIGAVALLLAVLAEGGEGPVLGESEYRLRVWKGVRAVGKVIGSVEMSLREGAYEGEACRVFRVTTRASCLGVSLDAVARSTLTTDLQRQLLYDYVRTGSKRVESRLVFRPTGIEWRRREPVKGADRLEWKTLATHRYSPGICDMFAALYLARKDALVVGGDPQWVRCVADRKLWDIGFRAVARERVTVPAGAFDTVRIEFEAAPANAFTLQTPFRGPFAMGADTKLWVDPERRLIVKVAGTAHLAVNVRAEMALVRTAAPGRN